MPNGKRPRVTIGVIAEEAGVSVPTVSKVLNGRAGVAADTRRRVEEVLHKRKYMRRTPSRDHGPGLIDLVFNELDSPWAVEIIRGVETVTSSAGVGVVVSSMQGRAEPPQRWLQSLTARRPDGVILVLSELTSRQRAQLATLGIPYVVVDPVGHTDPDTPSVGATNWAGGLAATDHLVELGHRRIAMISGPPRLLCSRARIDGYRAALEAAGLPIDPALLRYGDFHHETGYTEALALLRLPDPPSAIFAGSDQQAFGAYEAVHECGLKVPDDVSVVGFDDLPVASWVVPRLTTVRQPLAEMAAMATRMVLDMARGERIASPRVELATRLVVRESTAAPGQPLVEPDRPPTS
jgi:LacI family transcriptional regulator